MNKVFSAIDIGSNGIRMIISEFLTKQEVKDMSLNSNSNNESIQISKTVTDQQFLNAHQRLFKEIKKIRSPVRLGKDVFMDLPISKSTIQQAVETFEHFKNINERYHVTRTCVVATSALREAKNKNEFIDTIYSKTGFKIELIDGQKEAELIYLAVSKELNLKNNNCVLIDVGGGSVEITFSKNANRTQSKSFPMGTVRILDYLQKRNLKEEHLKVVIGDFISPVFDFINTQNENYDYAIGTGGNLECMARLKLEILKKKSNSYITLNELFEISEKLRSLTIKERIEKLHLRPDRADVILPAILIIKTIMRQSRVNKILIPAVGLRDGLLWSLVL